MKRKSNAVRALSIFISIIMLVLASQVYVFAEVEPDDMGLLVIGSDQGRTVIVDNDGNVKTTSGLGFSYRQNSKSGVLTLDNMNYGHYIYSNIGKDLEINVVGKNLFEQSGGGNAIITVKGNLKITGSGTLTIHKYYMQGYETGDYSSMKLSESKKAKGIHVLGDKDSISSKVELTVDGPTVIVQSVGEAIQVGDRYVENIDDMPQLRALYGKFSVFSGSLDLYSSFGSPAVTVYSETDTDAVYIAETLGAADANKIGGAYTSLEGICSVQFRDRINKKLVSHLYIDKKYRKYVTDAYLLYSRMYVRKDDYLQLRGKVKAMNGADESLLWSISGNMSSGTYISNEGKIYAAPDETATRLTVTVASAFDPTKKRSYPINVYDNPGRYDLIPYTGPDMPLHEMPISSVNTYAPADYNTYIWIVGIAVAVAFITGVCVFTFKRKKE